jgi:hypothetical protein
MGFLKKLFGQADKISKQEEVESQSHVPQNLPPCKSEQELLERYGAFAYEKQLDFAEVIGANNWNVDIQQGKISFGPDLNFSIQVLGTLSHSSATWLWAWANVQSGLPDNLLQHALKLKSYGEQNGIGLLTSSEFDATKDDMHLIGLIASGMFNAGSYYIADYGTGAMLVTITSERIVNQHNEYQQRVLAVYPQFISQFEVNHKQALISYLNTKGYAVAGNDNNLTATKGQSKLAAEFDESDRLTKLNG